MLHLICTLRSGDVTLFEEGGFACQSKAPLTEAEALFVLSFQWGDSSVL